MYLSVTASSIFEKRYGIKFMGKTTKRKKRNTLISGPGRGRLSTGVILRIQTTMVIRQYTR